MGLSPFIFVTAGELKTFCVCGGKSWRSLRHSSLQRGLCMELMWTRGCHLLECVVHSRNDNWSHLLKIILEKKI